MSAVGQRGEADEVDSRSRGVEREREILGMKRRGERGRSGRGSEGRALGPEEGWGAEDGKGKGSRGSEPRAAAAITLAVRTARYARKEKTTGSRAGLHSARRARRALRSGTTPHP